MLRALIDGKAFDREAVLAWEARRTLLTVEFPGRVPERMVAEHRWHLAVEFQLDRGCRPLTARRAHCGSTCSACNSLSYGGAPGDEKMRFRLERSVAGLATLVFLVTIATSSFLLFRQQQLAEQDPEFGRILLWQAVSYGPWIPFAWLLWRLFGTARLSPAAFGRYLLLGLVAVPVHAVGATLVDIGFSRPGGADLVALAVHRAQLDILIYSAFGLLAIAAEFQRIARDEAEVSVALKKAVKAAREGLPESSNASSSDSERLMVSVGRKRVPVEMSRVEWFGSAGNYVVVNWDGREGLIRQTLQSLELRLDPRVFARSHRTTIVNLSRVASAQSLSDGSWRLTTTSGIQLVASRTYRDEIMARLERTPVRPK